ncbi:MAG TPA: sulfotransferase [Phycisphaerales bacterium]|nr:sulfotransferase [Phycisphaerales bacterium]
MVKHETEAKAAKSAGQNGFSEWQNQSRLIESLTTGFVVGPPKCGTTWLMNCLNGHPQIVCGGECNGGRVLLTGLLSLMRAFNAHQVKYGQGPAAQLTDADAVFLMRQAADRQFVNLLANGRGGKRLEEVRCVIDKTPSNAQHLPLLSAVYAQAKFVCCVRDVRDGAVSGWFHFRKQKWIKETSIEEYAKAYATQTWAPMLKAARSAGTALGPARYMEWSYERSKENPGEEMRRVLNFLGMASDDASIRSCLNAGDFAKVSGGRKPGEEADSFYRKGVVGDHANHLSEEFGQELLRMAEDVLEPSLAANARA